MNKIKVMLFSISILLISFGIFYKNVFAITSSTTWNSSTEELNYNYEAKYSGIRRIWLECDGAQNVTITLYVHTNGFTTAPVIGTKDTNNIKNGTYNCKAYVATEGDNKERESAGDITFTKRNYDSSKDSSQGSISGSRESCTLFTTEENCNRDGTCIWNANTNTCGSTNVAERPCDEPDIRKVLRFFGYILLIAKVCIPLLIIGFGTFDLFKSVVDKDEKSLSKQLKQLGIRIISGFVVFFIPNIIYAIFGLSDALNVIEGEQYKACASCLLKPTDSSVCNVED